MERLLLIEFAATDRFHRGILFPYLFGFGKGASVPVRWLRFGVSAATRFLRREIGVGLDAAESERLASALEELQPTRVVFNLRPAPALVELVRRGAPAAAIGLLGETYAGEADAEAGGFINIGDAPREWGRLLGVDDPSENHAEALLAVQPDFGYEPANEAAVGMQPLPFILLGEECTYDRPLRKHPLFADLDLSLCVRQSGCTFCARPPSDGAPLPFSAQVARSQLEALVRTLPPHPGRLAIRLVGEPAIRHVEELVAICSEVDLGPSDLLFDARSDELVRRRKALKAAAVSLHGSGIRLHLALVGVENFSGPELARMNKGLTPLQNLDAARTLLELERDHSETFGFREHGGLSLILFTPWTTLEDLAVNLRIIQACGLERLCGKALTGRLRLEPGLPLTVLARRDGLVADGYADAAFDTAARNLYGEEVPWRFQDPRVEPVCQLLLRLSGTPGLDSEPLAARARALLGLAVMRGLTAVDVAVDVVERALPQGPAGSAVDLLDGLESALQDAEPQRYSVEEDVQELPADQAPGSTFDTDLLVALSRAGIKPVSKLELVWEREASALIERCGLPHARTYRPENVGEKVEIFFGEDPADVERAMRLTHLVSSAQDQDEYLEAMVRLGALLGYPECCVNAFAHRETARSRESWAWLRLARRIAVAGPVPPVMNPWQGFLANHYIPCSLGCSASLELMLRVHEAARELLGADAVAQAEQRMTHPWLSILRGQGSALELIPDEEPAERFRFRPGQRMGSAPELDQAVRADEIVLEPDRTLLRRQGRAWADLSVRAFVWWHQRPLQSELWSRVLALRALAQEPSPQAGRRRPSGRGPAAEVTVQPDGEAQSHPERETIRLDPAVARLQRILETALVDLASEGVRFGDHAEWELSARSEHALKIRLGAKEDSLVLYVTDARRPGPRLFRLGPFAFTSPQDHPVRTRAQHVTARDLARHLRAWLESQRRSSKVQTGPDPE